MCVINHSNVTMIQIETIQDLAKLAYLDASESRPLEASENNKEDNQTLPYCLFCNRYKTVGNIRLVDCYYIMPHDDDNKNKIDKRELRICNDCLNEYGDMKQMNRLVLADRE